MRTRKEEVWSIPREEFLTVVSTSYSYAMILERLGFNKERTSIRETVKERITKEGLVFDVKTQRLMEYYIFDRNKNIIGRVCGKCKTAKPIAMFSKKKKLYSSYCKQCSSDLTRIYYEKNKERYKNRIKRNKNNLRKWYEEIKSNCVCSKCGESHPACLVFHHIDPKEKIALISKMPSYGYSKKEIIDEMAKCIILCSNCHRKLHYTQTRKRGKK